MKPAEIDTPTDQALRSRPASQNSASESGRVRDRQPRPRATSE